jgi:hypothetical protein
MLCKRETAILKAKENIGGHRFSQVQHFSWKNINSACPSGLIVSNE